MARSRTAQTEVLAGIRRAPNRESRTAWKMCPTACSFGPALLEQPVFMRFRHGRSRASSSVVMQSVKVVTRRCRSDPPTSESISPPAPMRRRTAGASCADLLARDQHRECRSGSHFGQAPFSSHAYGASYRKACEVDAGAEASSLMMSSTPDRQCAARRGGKLARAKRRASTVSSR